MKTSVILSGVRPTEGRTNEAKNLADGIQILSFVHFLRMIGHARCAYTYYAQNDIDN